MRTRALIAGATLALLAGCARTPSPVKPAPAGAAPAAPTEPAVADPASYVARAASYDQLMIRAGQVVSQRSRSYDLLSLAAALSADHRGLAAQMSMAGRRLNLLPRPLLLPQHQRWLEEMTRAPDAGAAFRALARRVHQNSYAMHARFAAQGSSPTLRLVARNAAETERRHWAELQR